MLAQLDRAGSDVGSESRFGRLPIDQASIALHDTAVRELKRLGSRLPRGPRENAH